MKRKPFVFWFLCSLFPLLFVTYILGWADTAFRKTGVWYEDVLESFRYYALWVLPYWWGYILMGAILLSLVFYIVNAIFSFPRR